MDDNHVANKSEVMAMLELIICILISRIAYECSSIPFETMFLYISISIQLYEGGFRLLKSYNKNKQMIFKNTNDKNTKIRQIIQYNVGKITFKHS